jgi:hypothetical protein
MTGELNYGAGIPQETITQMQKTIFVFQQRYKDGYIGRSLVEQRSGLSANIRKDIVRSYDKTAAKDGISTAKISAGGTIPDIVGSKGKDKVYNVYRIDDAIMMNEAEIALDPNRWNTDVSLAMLECQRRENYVIINGQTSLGITGLVGMSTANSRGSITSGTNGGAWDGSETDKVMDPYDDLRKALEYVDPNLTGTLYAAGRPAYLNYLLQEDDLGKVFADKIGTRLFGRPLGDMSWMVKSDYFPANYVYIVLKTQMGAELLVVQDYNVDANYPRQPGQTQYAEIGGWIGMEAHNNESVVAIGIN